MKKTKVTAKDVAKRAGVSPATVSMILSGKGSSKFPEKTCRRVIDACNELGYVRNGLLRSSPERGPAGPGRSPENFPDRRTDRSSASELPDAPLCW